MITKNYINMCEKAEEIQKLWKPKIGDCCADPDHDDVVLASIGSLAGTKRWDIWLPTQEQLQEMVKDADFHIWGSFDNLLFLESAEDYHRRNSYLIKNNSMNELWLAFVMKEKYNKIWNGKDWVKYERKGGID